LGCRICRTIKPGKVVSKTVGLDGITPVLEAMGRYDTVGVVAIDLKIEGRYGQRNSASSDLRTVDAATAERELDCGANPGRAGAKPGQTANSSRHLGRGIGHLIRGRIWSQQKVG
jgi:hypothetical protein